MNTDDLKKILKEKIQSVFEINKTKNVDSFLRKLLFYDVDLNFNVAQDKGWFGYS